MSARWSGPSCPRRLRSSGRHRRDRDPQTPIGPQLSVRTDRLILGATSIGKESRHAQGAQTEYLERRRSRRLDRQLCDDWPRPPPRPDAQSAPWRELFLSALRIRLERSAHRPIGRPGGDRRGRAFYMPPATHPPRKQAPSSCNSVPPTGWRPRRLPL